MPFGTMKNEDAYANEVALRQIKHDHVAWT